MVETRGKSLEAIDQAFKEKTSGFSLGNLRRRNAVGPIPDSGASREGIHLPARLRSLS